MNHQKTNQSNHGGMYQVLKLTVEYVEDREDENFTTKELVGILDLCEQSVKNNITRLVKAGFIEKIERVRKGGEEGRGRLVMYRFNKGVVDHVRRWLY